MSIAPVAVGFTLDAGVARATGAKQSGTSVVHVGVSLTNTALGTGTQVDAVDMPSSTFGYGVASRLNNAKSSHERYYLIETKNAASSWSVRWPLPLPFATQGQPLVPPKIDFVNANVGYVQSLDSSPAIFVTKDVGEH